LNPQDGVEAAISADFSTEFYGVEYKTSIRLVAKTGCQGTEKVRAIPSLRII
jgi:hypothetical protein